MRREEHAWREKERERERRRRKTERRKNARRRSEGSERRRSEGSERRGSEKRKTAKIGGNEKKGRTISIMTGDTEMTRTTEEVRGAIERGIAIALLIATMIKVGASLAQKAKVGQRCPIASIRVSPINLFSLTTFAYNPLRILTINVHGLGTTCKRDLFLHELNEN